MAITTINVNGTEHNINDARVEALQTKIDNWGNKFITVNTYNSSTQLTGSVKMDKVVSGVCFSIRDASGTAGELVKNIIWSLSTDRKTINIKVNGSGFVSGHIVALNMMYQYT